MNFFKRYQPIFPWAILTTGMVLRCWQLMALPAWYDEAFTLLTARLPLSDLLQAVSGDVHPPLYYLIISALVHLTPLPDQLLALRSFSVACSAAGLAMFWHLSGLLPFTRPARLVALALFAFHPVAIYYSQEGRMYAWLTLLVLVACWALLKQTWIALGLATFGILYTHNYGMFYAAVLGLVGFGYYMLLPIPEYIAGKHHFLDDPVGKLVLSMGLPVALFLPWLWVLGHQMGQLQTMGYWLPDLTPGSVLMILHRVVLGSQLLGDWQLISVPLMAAGLVVCFAATRRQIVLWALVAGPVVLALAVSIIWGKPVLLYRGLIPSLPALAMLAGLAFTQATGPGRTGRWLLLAPLLIGLGGQIAYPYNFVSKTEVVWTAEVAQAPILVHMEDTSYITISAMFPGLNNYLLDAGCPEQPGGMSAISRGALGYKIITPDQLPDHYALAAVISTLSTHCHEDTFHRLTDGQPALMQGGTKFGVYGVWKIR